MALGAVVLAVTGAEALDADMGHFGQGALILSGPAAFEQPFCHLVPGSPLHPMIGLATLATVIASQAVISGVLLLCTVQGLGVDLMLTSFLLARESLILAPGGLNRLEERLYIALAASAVPATACFSIPPGRVVELGTQVEI